MTEVTVKVLPAAEAIEPCLSPKIDQREIERAGGEAPRRKFVSISEMPEALD